MISLLAALHDEDSVFAAVLHLFTSWSSSSLSREHQSLFSSHAPPAGPAASPPRGGLARPRRLSSATKNYKTAFCKEDFRLPCPKNFCLSGDKSCVAPFNWRGVCPLRNPKVSELSDLGKRQWAYTCDTPWPCVEDEEAHKNSEIACKNDPAPPEDADEAAADEALKQLYPDPTDPANPQNLTSEVYNPNAKEPRFRPPGRNKKVHR